MVVIENVEIGRKEAYRSAAWSGLLSPSFYKVGISGTILDEDKDHFRTLSITHKK